MIHNKNNVNHTEVFLDTTVLPLCTLSLCDSVEAGTSCVPLSKKKDTTVFSYNKTGIYFQIIIW
jgi:hypothetical protein